MEKETYPILPLRKMVVFPEQFTKLTVIRQKSIKAVEYAIESKTNVLLLPQYNYDAKSQSLPIYNNIGVVASVEVDSSSSDVKTYLLTGIKKVNIENVEVSDNFDTASVVDFSMCLDENDETQILYDKLIDFLNDENKVEDTFLSDAEIDINISKVTKFELCNILNTYLPYSEALIQLNERNLNNMIENLLKILNKQVEMAKLDRTINAKLKGYFDAVQKETYLREKMNVIQKELGVENEELELNKKIDELPLDEENRDKLRADVKRISKMSPMSAEYMLLKNNLDFVFELPWGKYTTDSTDLKKAKEILNRDHYGLEKIKDRILEFLAVHTLSKDNPDPILCFVGPPGVGKSSIVKSIADSINRKYVRMSLGGIDDEAEIRGHRKTYMGAMPGRIISTIKLSKVMNPVFLLDEIDKTTKGAHGDPAAALLEVLDPEFNSTFRDNYLEIPFDLKDVMFITTANNVSNISEPLLDRMEVIEMTGYTELEKREIAKRHLVDKQRKKCGLTKEQVILKDGVIEDVIEFYTREAGVRNLEKQIAQIMRRVARKIVEKDTETVTVTRKNLSEFLGVRKYERDEKIDEDSVGAATGLAWTSCGGTITNIEVLVMEGKGDIVLTGSLGDVLKESCRAALSYLKANCSEYGLTSETFEDKDVHIHMPEGATPKDGPSAGITLATAIYSAFSKKKVRADIAMTGEITLRGKVLPIGGLKEKLLAALRYDIHEVVIPKDNEKDLAEIPDTILKDIKINFVKDFKDVTRIAFKD